MKKFLKKKGTMIGSIVAAAVVLVLLLVFCIRPVSVWYTYKITEDDMVGRYHFDSFSEITVTVEKDGEEISKNEGYYFVKDGKLVPVMAKDKDSFKKQKEEILDKWDTVKDIYTIEINAFTMDMYGDTLTCVGAIVTVAILGVIEVVLAGMAISSVILRKKK